MPYIENKMRKVYDDQINYLLAGLQRSKHPGHLNYVITKLCSGFLSGKHYSDLNEVIGVLTCAQLELYRRLVVPLEDASKNLNGEVYDV